MRLRERERVRQRIKGGRKKKEKGKKNRVRAKIMLTQVLILNAYPPTCTPTSPLCTQATNPYAAASKAASILLAISSKP